MTVYTTRRSAIARVQAALMTEGYPRAVVLFVLALSGGAAFLFSAATLRLGLEHMGVRYFLATLAGYATFLVLIRAWIAYRRGFDEAADALSEIVDNIAQGDRHGNASEAARFAGGRGGGGGGGATWDSPSSAGVGDALNVDADELWPVILAVVCAIGALFALVYVVWAAPLLLAEVAVDAALVGTVYRRLRREDARHWLDAALRRTWLPALATSLLMLAAGFTLQWAAPGAQSIGAVLRALAAP